MSYFPFSHAIFLRIIFEKKSSLIPSLSKKLSDLRITKTKGIISLEFLYPFLKLLLNNFVIVLSGCFECEIMI